MSPHALRWSRNRAFEMRNARLGIPKLRSKGVCAVSNHRRLPTRWDAKVCGRAFGPDSPWAKYGVAERGNLTCGEAEKEHLSSPRQIAGRIPQTPQKHRGKYHWDPHTGLTPKGNGHPGLQHSKNQEKKNDRIPETPNKRMGYDHPGPPQLKRNKGK